MNEISSLECITAISQKIEDAPKFLGCAFVLKHEITNYIDEIYAIIPVEVMKKKQKKEHQFNDKIYDNIKNFEIFLDISPTIFGLSVLRLKDVSIHLQTLLADIESINS